MTSRPPTHPSLAQESCTEVPESGPVPGSRRLRVAERQQQELRAISLDGLIESDHRVRKVWAWVEKMDDRGALQVLYDSIRSAGSNAGAPATDPKLLLALWLYATLEGVGSARELARLSDEHVAYQWLCGGVPVCYRLLSQFRVGHEALLSDLLTRSVASLIASGVVTMTIVAQDGMRVRAAAGADSFHRPKTLQEALTLAQAQVAALKRERERPNATRTRQEAAKQRAAQDLVDRLEAALCAHEELARKEALKKPGEQKPPEEIRVSSTDAAAAVMKMPDGGFRPALNVQYATDTATQIIVGVGVTNVGSDLGQLGPMMEKLVTDYGTQPEAVLADGGYAKHEDITALELAGTKVYAPVPKRRGSDVDPHERKQYDSDQVAAWRARMATEAGKSLYTHRAATAECVNALARNRGLLRLVVRGVAKAHSIALLFAIAHNLLRETTLAT